MFLVVFSACLAAVILAGIRIKEGTTGKKIGIAALYLLFFILTYYAGRKATTIFRGDFQTGPNYFIWICLLLGALFYFPDYKNVEWKKDRFICLREEIGKSILFIVMTALGFCTQGLERINMPCQITGPVFLCVLIASSVIRYFFKGKERALDFRDILILFLLAGIYYVFGFVICYRNTFNQAPFIFYNVVILFVILLLVLFITANMNVTVMIGGVINCVWTMAHYLVYNCRGSIFVPNDLRSIGTAATVVGQYDLYINSDIWRMCAFSLVLSLIALNYKKVYVMKARRRFSIVGTLILSVLMTGWYQSDFIENMNLPYEVFKQDTFYDRVGHTLGFIEIMKKTQIKEPENYSEEEILALASKYKDASVPSEVQPNIIVIMNETFSDIGDLGELETNTDYMPYYHSLSTDSRTAVGRTLVSVLGGNTCQSEYEFLTGNSIAFSPEIFPYATEIHGDTYSIVSTLKDQGYQTRATHPFIATNWKRNVIYRYLQFDEMYFLDDYDNPELVREYVSDREVYKHILKWIDEAEDGKPQFVFAVTMQNHGGYTGDPLREGEELPVVREGIEKPEAVDEYLSLIYESDKALEELISQVDAMDEPSIVVMFGDHMPSMIDESWKAVINKDEEPNELEELQKLYATPYIVHANYDINADQIPQFMSVNYLRANILKAGGVQMTAFDHYLLDMQKEIPAFNAFGFLGEDGRWYRYSEDYPKEYDKILKEYNNVQFNARYKKASPEMFAFSKEK